jgi:ABC-2 type transport system ATP-binding protein
VEKWWGFLGSNGAGKSTTIQMLVNLVTPTRGEIWYFGKRFDQAREETLRRINYSSAFNELLGRITVRENLEVYAGMYEVENIKARVDEVVGYFDLGELMNKLYWSLSSGQRTRVNLAKAMINEPELVLMDEPTASLDPDVADRVMTLIERLRDENGMSILYTSHDMDEIARICDEVIFLDRGEIVAKDTPIGLVKKVKVCKLKLMIGANLEKCRQILAQERLGVREVHGRVEVEIEESQIGRLLAKMESGGVEIVEIDIEKVSLEQVFLDIARSRDE